jgi:simple sugar transport system permease protein
MSIRLEARPATATRDVITPVLAVGVSLLLGAILIGIAGANPLSGYTVMFKAAFVGKVALTETLVRATPMVLTGLSAVVALRAQFWNIGGEGQLLAGAMAAAYVGTLEWLPQSLLIPTMIMAALAGGAAAASIPAVLKTQLKVDEVVSSLMFNFIISYLMLALLSGPWKDPVTGWTDSPDILSAAEWPTFWRGTRLHLGVLLALLSAVAVHLMIRRTTLGLSMDIVGRNSLAARHAGLSVRAIILTSALISGSLAGLAGAGEVGGLHFQVMPAISPGYGYAGLVVAMLARLSPLGVIPAALFLAAVATGSDEMSRALNVPVFLADALQGLTLLAVLIAFTLSRYRIRIVRPAHKVRA